MRLHPWHEIPIGSGAPEKLNFIVEVPRKSTTKYELNPELGVLCINRIMHPPIPYPSNYGFIPQTLDEDGDPLDALVLMQNRAEPLTVLSARPIGVANLKDRGKADDKVVCVHVDDPKYADCQSIEELPDYEQDEIKWFFEDYKETMQKDVKVEGLNGIESAYESIQKCCKRYQDKFPDGWSE